MSKALSVDLRERVAAAVAAGASCRGGGPLRGQRGECDPLGCAEYRERRVRWRPRPLGGDRRSARIEAHAGLILRLVDQKSDMTLQEIRAELAKAGVSAGIGTLWRFFARRGMTWKKSRRIADRGGIARTS